MRIAIRPLLISLLVVATAGAQGPRLRYQAAARFGQAIDTLLLGKPGSAFATFWDFGGGPQSALGERFWLDLSPRLLLIDAGTLDGVGARSRRHTTPKLTQFRGLALFAQSIVFDTSAKNGLFLVSNGASTVLHNGSFALACRFDDPAHEGFTGSYDKSAKDRLMAAVVTHRLVRPIQKLGGLRFPLPLNGVLTPYGARQQMVYRAVDLGGSGKEEVLRSVFWRPFSTKIQADRFQRIVLSVGHTRVVPDYRLSGFTGLPLFPASGLSKTLASNRFPNEKPIVFFDSSYSVDAKALRADGYIPYPQASGTFVWNGSASLLLDFQVVPTSKARGWNGMTTYLQIRSSALPNSRVQSIGNSFQNVDPFRVTVAAQGDNTVQDLMFEFSQVQSEALSPWLDSGHSRPNYDPAILAASTPRGTGIQLEFQGARDAKGTGATTWSRSIDGADGQRFVRYRVRFTGDFRSGARPSLDSLVIPYR